MPAEALHAPCSIYYVILHVAGARGIDLGSRNHNCCTAIVTQGLQESLLFDVMVVHIIHVLQLNLSIKLM